MRIEALATHSGRFHADDVCAAAVLRELFPLCDLIRTRDEQEIRSLEGRAVIFDVGGVNDPARMIFDHHMRGAETREDGTVYSSFGLIWRQFGEGYVRSFHPDTPDEIVTEIVSRFDRMMVIPIDMIDNGALSPAQIGVSSGISLGSIVDSFNGDEPEKQDKQFVLAARMVNTVLASRVTALRSEILLAREVEAAVKEQWGEPILHLERSADAQPVLDRLEARHVRLIVQPSSSGGFGVATARESADSYVNLIKFPESWAGLTGEDLEGTSGVEGATFCHSGRFYVATKTLEAALQVAEITLDHDVTPEMSL